MSDIDPTACADAYRALRERVCEMIRGVDPAALVSVAPATPAWRVRDVLAHVVGVNTDILTGTLDGVAGDAWTAAQVTTRRDWPIEQILAEWVDSASQVEANAAMLGSAVGQWLLDACTHEHDIRQALGCPGARDSDAVDIGFEWASDRLSEAFAQHDTPSLTLHTDVGTRALGTVAATTGTGTSGVRASRFELVRTMTGRRSRAQVEAYEWDGPARPDALVLSIFTLRAEDFDE